MRGIDICHETVRLWWNRPHQMKSPQKFTSIHTNVHDFFNPGGHLVTA